MNVRLLLTAGALSLGLATAALAQGMQPGMGGGMQPGAAGGMGGGMEPGMGRGQMGRGQMGDDMGMEQRPMRRNSKRMRRPTKKQMMRSRARMKSNRGMGPARGNAQQQTGGM